MKICSKCSSHQYGEKSTKFFYGLEKKKAICGNIKALINDGKEITMSNEINLTLNSFYENLFQKDVFQILKLFKVRYKEKKDREKRFNKNLRPISLLNVDTKILLKAFAAKC